MLFVPAVPNDSIHIQSLTGSEKIAFTAGIHLICCSFLCSFFWGGFCHPAILSGNIVPERVNLMAVYREGKNPLLLKKGKGEREKEGGKKKRKRGNEKSPLSQKEPSQWSRVSSGYPGLERLLCKQQNADGRST